MVLPESNVHITSILGRSCGFPGYLPGGTFSGRSFLYTDTIRYVCHFDAQILGNSTRVCQADGEWSGEPPICKGNEFKNTIITIWALRLK